MKCKHCGSERLVARGSRGIRIGARRQYQCRDCKKYSSEHITTNLAANILFLDIETLPLEVYVWGLKNNDYIQPGNIIKDWSIACWSAKWIFDSKTYGQVVTPQEAVERKDDSVLESIWKLMDKADIVVTQNGKEFDLKRLNTKFVLAGFPPPMYYSHIDTLVVLRSKFAFSSNKLDYVNEVLGINQKSPMEMEDWIGCTKGQEESLKKMLKYCKRDVGIHEEMYLKIRPWISPHANLGIYADTDKDCCPNCQSTELKWNGRYSTAVGVYDAFRCVSCGAIGRSTNKQHLQKKVETRS